jgi:hypothetical protein
LGDNFVVNSKEGNIEGVDFYILLCTKIVFTFSKPFTCPWGQQFSVGDMVVVGKYYQKWGRSESSYVLLRSSNVAFIHVCHIRAIKFPMLPVDLRVQGNDLVYRFPEYAEDGIRQRIVAIEL